jgi:peptidylprolyl isomerase
MNFWHDCSFLTPFEGEVLMKKFFALFLALLIPVSTITAQEKEIVKNPIVVFETNQGTFEITLNPEAAPKTCENFLGLVAKGYYDGIVFHRVIKNFMIQGGDPTGTGAGGESIWGKAFADECKPTLKFDKPGLLAMANRGPNTNGSQFFITTAATPWLNMRHTIFGEVTTGYDIVKKIENSPTAPGDRPVEPIKIKKAFLKS